ncbi:MAG: metalloregulator ArsR/SmtB family transcription factor [Spirochaetia bacterium]|nr:metalloregulator ArsR/SmtB family transcription factor [Spirochaetia bacterium]
MASMKRRTTVKSLGPKSPGTSYAQWARIFRALGHPTRLFVFDRVSHQPESVMHLAEMVGDDPSTLSRHLHVLVDAGLLHCREDGTFRYYSAVPGCTRSIVRCIHAMQKRGDGLQSFDEPHFDKADKSVD